MSHNLIYAGVGARKTPPNICRMMSYVAEQLSPTGWLLRSGGAYGADQAFERGAKLKEIHLPWDGYNNVRTNDRTHFTPIPTPEMVDIAARHHPAWENLSDSVRMFMVRNTTIVLGMDLASPVKMLICWTEDGKEIGGTSHAIRIARSHGIPIFNIANPQKQNALAKFVLQFGD
jgi:hypothetical protein